jgi:predicted nuclease of predicted toxin-antitoxin system
MKILLDECPPLDFRHHLQPHIAHTAEWAGLKGRTNGELLRAAKAAGYEVLLTVDQGIPHQQNVEGRKIAVIVVRARTNQLEELAPLAGAILQAVKTIGAGQVAVMPGPAD